ncbi:hypothetical protein B7R54_02635 [Subtercola boreus]|uniref:Short-chain dehydrogenase n=1 Tax=Subtercola boreus TaxID=120213 RepID=A0A3E0VFB4_9MICO|nr:SDR family NAD(P)-dependent oxidoreductase [Subtercola boreus]RFA08243.1 hypothetical protein B7R54_02635 [Subtercola boreus]TQL54863.1 NAD(P)-dependent dehydrogenase (short-subunit alcohol dehydrogenase family) [Subtercola boreus]
MSGSLAGKQALVTGSTSGIGRAIARAMAAEGASVVVTGRSEERGRAVVDGITADGGTAFFVRADLNDGKAGIDALVAAIQDRTGRGVDILVNNASYNIVSAMSTVETPESLMDSALLGSVKGTFLVTAACLPWMIAQGSGRIINMGSVMGIIGKPGGSFYTAVKAAVHGMTLGWTAEYASLGINTNTIAPGTVLTDAVNDVYENVAPQLPFTPTQKFSTPEDVAAVAVFLAGPGAANICGVTIPVDGGWVAV